MQIYGYSERGMINSLLYECMYRPNSIELIGKFLERVRFPYKSVAINPTKVQVLIEQSFSDFGDSDVVFLIDTPEDQVAVFVEAKVKTSQGKWDINKHFKSFNKGIENNKLPSSSLFTQLYFKLRLAIALKADDDLKQLQKKGIEFPRCSSKKRRKIGENKVVLKAVKTLQPYIDTCYYVGIVPDDTKKSSDFYETLKNTSVTELPEWDISHWGFITWNQVEEFCSDHQLKETQANFRYNGSQIYKKRKFNKEATIQPIPFQTALIQKEW